MTNTAYDEFDPETMGGADASAMTNEQLNKTRSRIKTITEMGTVSHPYIRPGTRRSIVVWAERTNPLNGERIGREFRTAKAAREWLG